MAHMNRVFLVVGNWKMNGDKQQINEIINNLKKGPINRDVEVVVAVPFIYMNYVKSIVPDTVKVGAQNCWITNVGSYTGEISPTMLKDIGVNWVIIGHCERRVIFSENDKMVAEKVSHALDAGMNVIVCIGESRQERDTGMAKDVIIRQLSRLAPAIGDKWANVVIAYQPLWAVISEDHVSALQAQIVAITIRHWVENNVSPDAAHVLRIQFGGCITASNCRYLAGCTEIDGLLVEGASLKPEFVDIINATISVK